MSEAMVAIYVPNGRISVPADAVMRLEDWSNWTRLRAGLDSHGRCSSAEGGYESKSDNGRSQVVIKHDLVSVLAVEKIVCTKLPRLQREVIQRHFVFRYAPKIIACALSIHRAQYGHELKRSVLMVKNNLTRV